MSKWLAIAAYRCEINGEPTDSLDIRVRSYNLPNETEVKEALIAEPSVQYTNESGENVVWLLSTILAIEKSQAHSSGDELIGFIANISEIQTWTVPSA